MLQLHPAEFRFADWLRDFQWVSDDNLVDCWDTGPAVEEAQTGDTVFIWNGGSSAAGLCGQAKVVAIPEVFSLAVKKREYFMNLKEPDKADGNHRLALKYSRISLGAPLLKTELESQGLKTSVPPPGVSFYRLPDNEGKAIERVLRGRTIIVELPYCRT